MVAVPEFLPPDKFVLELVDGHPTVTLPDTQLSNGDGWSFLNRATLLVLDGPGDDGFLLPRLIDAGGDAAPSGWDAAVERAGGVAVRASDREITARLIVGGD